MRVMAAVTKLEPYIVPDEFSFSFSGKGEAALTEYTERGAFQGIEDRRRFENEHETFLERNGIPKDAVESRVSDGGFEIKIALKERREIAISRIFNEVLFQMKCFYSDNDIHRMVDRIVVSEALEEDTVPLFPFIGLGSFPGVGFYVDFSAPDVFIMRSDSFKCPVKVLTGFRTMNYCTGGILGYSNIQNCLSGVYFSPYHVPVSFLLPVDHYSHDFNDRIHKKVLPELNGADHRSGKRMRLRCLNDLLRSLIKEHPQKMEVTH